MECQDGVNVAEYGIVFVLSNEIFGKQWCPQVLDYGVDALNVVFFRLDQLLNVKLTHHTSFPHLQKGFLVLLDLYPPVDQLLQ